MADIELVASPFAAGSAVAHALTERGLSYLDNRHNVYQRRATVSAAEIAGLFASVGAFTPAIVIADAR
jgi:hypothetical protein